MITRIFSRASLRPESQVELTGDAARHVGKVLRLRAGDEIVIFAGDGLEYDARIDTLTRERVTATVGAAREPGTESGLDVTLLQGICRSQRMDLLIQKATELGVRSIRPVNCERGVVRLDGDRGLRKIGHWRKIAISASEQSGRVRVPDVAPPASLDDALRAVPDDTSARMVLDPRSESKLGTSLAGARRVALLVGPEGGLTDGERTTARSHGFVAVRLGPRILRTETAPLAALSILQYLAGDLG
jgi:16S rRNA (uracil1498-N3)-methyltransferase